MKKIACVFIALTILTVCCCAVDRSFGCYEYDNPMNLLYYEYPEFVKPADSNYDPELVDPYEVGGKMIDVYKNPYASGDSDDLSKIDYYYEVNDDLIAKSVNTLKTFVGVLGSGYSAENMKINSEAGGAYLNFDKVTVDAVGDVLTVSCSDHSASDSGAGLDDFSKLTFFNAAVKAVGIDPEKAYYTHSISDQTKQYDGFYTISEIRTYKDKSAAYALASVVMNCKNNGNTIVSYTLKAYINGVDKFKVGTSKAITYSEALTKLKEHECYGIFMFDENLDYNDVTCDFVYTDLISRYRMTPCYKFYVRVLNDDHTGVKLDEENKYYNTYYVPAVDMNENPETGETDPVAAAVCAVASAVLLAAAQINLKKFRKNT